MTKLYDYLIKIIVIGESTVGKSCLVERMMDDRWNPNMITTIGIDFKVKTILIDNKLIKIQIWDTAGQERFYSITKAYYRGIFGSMVVYDVTNQKSFESITKWINNLKENADCNVFTCIIGTKNDLLDKKVVPDSEAYALASKMNVPLYFTSAKTNENVTETLHHMVNQVYTVVAKNTQSNKPIDLIEPNSIDKNCC